MASSEKVGSRMTFYINIIMLKLTCFKALSTCTCIYWKNCLISCSCYANLQLSQLSYTIVNLHSMTCCYASPLTGWWCFIDWWWHLNMDPIQYPQNNHPWWRKDWSVKCWVMNSYNFLSYFQNFLSQSITSKNVWFIIWLCWEFIRS